MKEIEFITDHMVYNPAYVYIIKSYRQKRPSTDKFEYTFFGQSTTEKKTLLE